MKIFFLTHRDKYQASSRYRVYQFIPSLEERGFKCSVNPLPEQGLFKRLFFIIFMLLKVRHEDICFIQKILFPVPVIYFLRLLSKHLIFDWDDALYSAPPSQILSARAVAKRKRRLNKTLKLCDLIICGNDNLRKYSSIFNNNSVVVPTSIDMNIYQPRKAYNVTPLIIGWIGRSDNLTFLVNLESVFEALHHKYKDAIALKVVCDRPFRSDSGINVMNKKWVLEEEISDVQSFDIGIMPLDDNEWSRGKCAFKALQYLAVGIPCVASPVGINSEVIKNGYNGYLANSPQEWTERLSALIDKPELRASLGDTGREYVVERYSIGSIIGKLTSIFMTV
jgi:glycosyltransferase involved in cell wall biosynthesis